MSPLGGEIRHVVGMMTRASGANPRPGDGEPDIDVRRTGDDLTVEIRGLDVYDPTTGAIRSHSVDDIATWFIDTDYDGNLFRVRHAYFLGGDDPYEKLRRALKADINEDAWATLYSATSRPFPRCRRSPKFPRLDQRTSPADDARLDRLSLPV